MASLRILCDLELPDQTLRIWDGTGGIFIDGDGNRYRPSQFTEEALQSVEAAINGEAFTLPIALINIPTSIADSIWTYDETTPIDGSPFILKLQELDALEQPVGDPEVRFTGTIDNMEVSDQASDDGAVSVVQIDVTNAFTLRVMTNGSVLSDVDQKARSAILNPSADPDRACERIPGLRDKKIKWPNW